MARRKCIVGGDLSHGTQSNVDGDDTVLFLRGVRCGSGTTRFCSKYCTAFFNLVMLDFRFSTTVQ